MSIEAVQQLYVAKHVRVTPLRFDGTRVPARPSTRVRRSSSGPGYRVEPPQLLETQQVAGLAGGHPDVVG
jgi:hypothetical protein